jgi:DNA-binding NarL/FixJ family response regulator
MEEAPRYQTPSEVRAQRQQGLKLGVFVVDPLPTVRAGLTLLIDGQEGMETLAECGSSSEMLAAVKGVDRRSGLVVLLGLGLSGEHDSFWLIRTLRDRFPSLAILACGADSDKTAISRAMFVGADGFVDKNASPDNFIDALRRCANGEVVVVGPPAEWLGPISEEIDRQRENGSPLLTEREVEVITLAAEGLTAREIGERLDLRERTVTTHLGRIYGKLGVGTRIAAIATAQRAGILTA